MDQRLCSTKTKVASCPSPNALSPADRARLQALTEQSNRIQDTARTARESWGRNTSIILIVFATFVMAISLVRAEQLPVINNGLLLGGVFTMIYGVGWIIASSTSIARFTVLTVALAITLTLGYMRFARGQPTVALTPAPDVMADKAGLAGLEERVTALENRIDEAANVLGRKV
jgi:hypothetical protein